MKYIGEAMGKRTTVKFSYDGDIWTIVEDWARETGYRRTKSFHNERTYKKGGWIVAPQMLRIQKDNADVTLEAWVKVHFIARMLVLFTRSSTIGIESGGGIMCLIPRDVARMAVNNLLRDFGQSPIR